MSFLGNTTAYPVVTPDPADTVPLIQGGVLKQTLVSDLGGSSGGAAGLKSRAVVLLIHDTDLGDDCDDIGSFAVMHRLADLGECEVLACGYACDPSFTWGARAIAALNTYFGRPDIPVGVFKGTGFSTAGHDNYGTYLATKFPSGIVSTTNVEEAYKLYRRVLAAQPDVADSPSGGVTFMTQGQLANLNALYNSAADEYSALTGEELMLAKVKEIVILGGTYPTGSEFDFTSDPTSAQVINQLHADLRVVYSGGDYGNDVFTNSAAALYGPVRNGFDEFFRVYPGALTTRESWGAMCVIYAVRGLSFGGDTYSTLSAQGANAVDGSGNNTFTTGSTKTQFYLIRSLGTSTFASRIMALQDADPVGRSPRYRFNELALACSDRTTALTTATNVASARVKGAGYAQFLASIRTSLEVANSSSGLVTVDANKNGSTMLPTKCSIDSGESTSITAATPAVIGAVNVRELADDDVVSADIDAAGTGAKGLIVYLGIWTLE